MAKEMFIDVHLDLSFSPLTVTTGITVDGNVADVQTYDQSAEQFAPDYTQTFLVLVPRMVVADPDGMIAAGAVQMTNMHWFVTENGTEKEVANGPDYQMSADGRISIRRNVDAGKTLLFRFTGEWLDPRTGDLYRMEKTHTVSCESESAPAKLSLNFPELTEWDPTTGENAVVKIKADLKTGSTAVAAANREFVWEKKDRNDADFCRIYRETDANYDLMDYDVALSADGTTLTLDRSLMGDGVEIRCRAKYDPYGAPGSVTLNDRSPQAKASFSRTIPVPTVVALSPQKFDPSQKTFSPEAAFFIGRRQITDPSKWWRTRWYMSKGVAAGTVSRTLVGEGVKPSLSTSLIAQSYGATLQPGITEIGPLSALVTADGSVIVTSDGAPILVNTVD